MKLVIIEGEGKRETIGKYLKKIDSDFTVFATKGHIRDLPPKSLAINVKNNFEPKYAIMEDKKHIVSQLENMAKKADAIYLATDPDREGEAISWHLEQILDIPQEKPCRIVFNEISPKAVAHAIQNPRTIDLSLVDAQQARRVLDRLVGYKLSPVLCKKIQSNLSAGRVQSVALRLTVDREREIINFKPEEFWTLTAMLLKDKVSFKSMLVTHLGKKVKPKCKEDMDKILSNIDGATYRVTAAKKGVTKSHAPAPFITSTMQQDALNKLGLSLKQSTQIAQKLYEGVDIEGEGKVALVTYIRTDSTRVSEDAQNAARDYIRATYGDKFVPEKPNFYKSKKDAQDAHEAVRPINIELAPDSLKGKIDKNCYRLYKLIYDRFLASQMSEAEYNTVTVGISANDYEFKTTGKTLLFAGFTAAYTGFVEEKANTNEEDEDNTGLLPSLEVGDVCELKELKPEQKFTKPPLRFTEASLIKAMEEKGIGRPATYTPTITTLAARSYTEKEGKYLKPTDLGCTVVDMLVKYFEDIMDVGFTANMETNLDDIEFGGKVWQKVVEDFYLGFDEKLKAALGDDYTLKEPPVETDIKCEKCGSPMLIRTSKYGKFLACSAYPKCKNTHHLDTDGNIVKEVVPVETNEVCPNCGSKLVIKVGRFGQFMACPNYPKCKYIKNMDTADSNGGICPDCGGALRKRHSMRGDFYGCENYPKCKFLSSDPVLEEKCPDCGGYLVKHKLKDGFTIKCGKKDCKYARPSAEQS